MNKQQNGFSLVLIVIVIVVLGAIGLVGAKVLSGDKKSNDYKASDSSQNSAFIWRQTANGWEAEGTAPDCPAQPMLKAPADTSKVTAVLYPGQTRGQYKPHGGLRFDNIKDNTMTVVSPIDGYIIKATRNFAQGTTETQYGFDIMSNCGVMIRLGHLQTLTPEMQKIVEKLPAASADARIENVNPPVYIKQGTVMATKVGLPSEQNTFFDWGVYDYRQENAASKSAAYKAAHPMGDLAWHAVCWLQDDWLPGADQAKLAALPAGDGANGKTSDYCK